MTFVSNNHKAIWAAKYCFILVRENKENEVEVFEEVSLYNLNIFIYLHKFNRNQMKMITVRGL